MEFKDGASIYTVEGKDIGNLYRVVIDPETKKVTHIVSLKGLFSKEDKVIPVEHIVSTNEDEVRLSCTVDEVKEMAPLDIEHYAPMNETTGDGGRVFDPLVDGMYRSPLPERTVIEEVVRTIPEELIALKEGARVTTPDEEHVGNVERIFTHPDTGCVNYFIVAQGLLTKTRKSIPVDWVKLLDEDEVVLTIGSKQYDDLAPVQE